MRKVGLILLFSTIWLVCLFGVAEIWARMKFGTVCTEAHEIFHHRFIPNVTCITKDPEFSTRYEVNSLGLRNRELAIPKPDHKKRILVVGDSLTQGAGVDQDKTFSVLLENILVTKDKNVEVINAGLSANSPIIIYLWLRELGLRLNPDLVVMTVNETDFSEEQKYDSMKVVNLDGSVRAVPGRPLYYLPRPISRWLQRHSSFYIFFNARIMSRIISWKANFLSRYVVKPKVDNYQGGITATGAYDISRGVSDNQYAYLRDLLQKNLLLTVDLLIRRDIRFVLVVQPHAHEVSETAWPGRVNHGLLMNKIYSPRFYDSFMNMGKDYNFPVFDLRPAFTQPYANELFYPSDGHWTEKGHKVAAAAMVEFLTSNNIF